MKEYNEQVVETLDDAGCIIANKNIIIDNLQARIAELEEENARLNLLFVKAAKGKGENLKECFSLQQQLAAVQEENGRLENQVLARDAELWGRTQEILGLKEQLAAEQLNNKLLRKALEAVIKVHGYESGIPVEAISTQASTEALDKYVAEKMKEYAGIIEERCDSIATDKARAAIKESERKR